MSLSIHGPIRAGLSALWKPKRGPSSGTEPLHTASADAYARAASCREYASQEDARVRRQVCQYRDGIPLLLDKVRPDSGSSNVLLSSGQGTV